MRFGELVELKEGREGLVRRAGFGTADETVHLKRGVTYGRKDD